MIRAVLTGMFALNTEYGSRDLLGKYLDHITGVADPIYEAAASTIFASSSANKSVRKQGHSVEDEVELRAASKSSQICSPAYKDIVARLKSEDSFIDIGCFLGQESRKLVWDLNFAPADQLHAVDIINHWDLGY
ncbi:uncharacterized protein Bfra_000556 [Botrytis fragariae]|uniref:Uncharacterized protein n=1 Tax=Botrytis fragariae TaxID=1964551 RepID=A0A8H6B2X0_9HELO|nr:uncharacterized protein Bfra_000556 [Botrytis fragariae]KAF5878391.1 hypothetical protein Bfra_000556 [Botrytis fragariae]